MATLFSFEYGEDTKVEKKVSSFQMIMCMSLLLSQETGD